MGDSVADGLPAGAVSIDIAVLELDPGALRGFGDEPHLDLAGVVRVGDQLPVRPDVPAENHAVIRFVGQDARPAALAAVLGDVDDVPADPRLEHRPRDGRVHEVVLGRLEVAEAGGEHLERPLLRHGNDDLLAHGGGGCLGHDDSCSGPTGVSTDATASWYPASALFQ